MTKKLNLSVIAIVVFSLFLTVSCTNDSEPQNDTTFQREFNITPLNKQTGKMENYKITGNSNVDFNNQQINLEIPVPLNDFTFSKAYNISTDDQPAILVVLTRNSTEIVNDLPTNYLIETNISFNEVNLNADILDANANLNIFVMNSTRVMNTNDSILTCFADHNTDDASKIDCMDTSSTNRTDSADGPNVTKKGKIIL